MGRGPHPGRGPRRRAASSSRASSSAAPDRAQPIVVYCAGGQPLGVRGEDARGARLRERRLARRRLHRLEAQRLPDPAPRTLDAEKRSRYSRHLLIPEVGEEGQLKLLESRVLLIGAGGLGSPAVLYLAAAGVGTLGIVDDDRVDASNLQRQIAHSTETLGELEGRLGEARRSRR